MNPIRIPKPCFPKIHLIALMTEAAKSSKTLVNFYQTKRRYNSEDSHLCTNRRENLKSYILVLSSHLRLGLPSGLLPSGSVVCTSHISHARHMPSHIIILALFTLIIMGEEYKPCSSSLYSFLQPPVTSSLLGQNILLSALI
jgi:hypothetical protein